MKAVFVIISFTLLLFFLQTSAEETKDASISREVRAADAGKKESRIRKKKKQCKGKKCKRARARKAGKGKGKKKCKKGKNCRRGKKGDGRKAEGKKGKQGKQGKKKRGGKGRKGKGGKGGKGKKGKGGKVRNGKGRKRKNGKGGKGKKGRKFRNSGKQNATVPAKCSANTCTASDNVDLFNKYKKNDNMLRQLQRLVRFYDLITKKGASALTTFEPAAGAIGTATSDCSTCADASMKTAAIGNCTILKNCSVSAPAICNINGITYDKIKSDCKLNPDGTCPAGTKESQCGDACPKPDPTGPPDCSDVCKIDEGPVAALTSEDKTFAETDCIPVIRNWVKQYRDCNAGDTFGCQQSGCNKLKGECNLKNCRCDTPDRTCDFEECVDAKNPDGKDYKDYVCNTCLKNLEEKLKIPAKCATIAKYERAVFARKEECIRKEKTGSFGDCVSSQKAIIPMIIPCMGEQSDVVSPTTMAPTGRLSALKNKNMMFKNKNQLW